MVNLANAAKKAEPLCAFRLEETHKSSAFHFLFWNVVSAQPTT